MIKNIFKKIIEVLLKWEAGIILWKYNPKIVAISGTVGKTSTKNAVHSVLSRKFDIRISEKSYNSDFGVALTILGESSGWNNPIKWFGILLRGLKLMVFKSEYPQWLILEMGVDHPGDMKRLVSWIRPDISVMTAIGEVPVHVEYFGKVSDVAKEKSRLIKVLKLGDYAVLNGDDPLVSDMKDKTKANVLTYGLVDDDKGADRSRLDLIGSNYGITYRIEGERNIPDGLTFKVDYNGNIVPVRLHDTFGRQNVYASLAAIAVGIAAGLNLIEMAESLSQYRSPAGRLKLLKGIKNSFLLDDTYNSSPLAVQAALDVLDDLPAKRKIVILGDMLELGKHTIDEHKKIGTIASRIADVIFVVGARSKFISEAARENGFSENKIFEFPDSDIAKIKLQEFMEEDDIVLIKGSQSMRMEKIVEEVMAEPERKGNLLVRQEVEWKKSDG